MALSLAQLTVPQQVSSLGWDQSKQIAIDSLEGIFNGTPGIY